MELNKEIARLLNEGLSLRKIAVTVNISYGACRARAINLGLYKPKLKNVQNNKAICLRCSKSKKLSEFPYVASNGKYICSHCLGEEQHMFQVKKLGCTPELYDSLLKKQNGKCAICDKDFGHVAKNGKKTKLAVDHDHKTLKIRGLLCSTCNRGLGYLKESNLESALKYCQRNAG